jgi:DNA-directed RNA polymerase subunit RPC12/RpoP
MTPSHQSRCSKCGQSLVADSEAPAGQEIRCPSCGEPTLFIASPRLDGDLSGYEVYNIVSDLGTGVNVRWRDNLYQFVAIGICLAIGILVGALVIRDHIPGAITGGFVGLLVGLLGSGAFLMVYRFVRHLLGDHR